MEWAQVRVVVLVVAVIGVVVGGMLVWDALDRAVEHGENRSPESDMDTVFDAQHPGEVEENGSIVDSGERTEDMDEEGAESFLFHPPEGCVSDPDPVFTQGFIDLSRVAALNPIGDPGGGSPGRSYIPLTAGEPVSVYAPADGRIDRITYADRGAGYGEYGVSFWVTCEVHILFDHLSGVPPWLEEHAPETAANHTSTGTVDVDLPVTAGDVVGYKEGGEDAATLDFLLQNAAKRVEYINPDRFVWDQSLYVDCPYDYFAADVKEAYYGKLGVSSNEGLIPAEDCGSPSHDVAGTASGAWFIGENSTEFDGKYLQVSRYVNQARIVLKDETLTDREDARFAFRVYDPEYFPEEIEVGETHCYERHPGEGGPWAYVEVLPNQQLSVAYDAVGGCPSEFPDTTAATWSR